MASLSNIEKIKLEKFFGMASGYVLDFSNRSFQEFIFDSVGIDIYDEKYDYDTGSKANRLRAFWSEESDYLVSILLNDLLEYWKTKKLIDLEEITQPETNLYEECLLIVERLEHVTSQGAAETFQSFTSDKKISLLAESIRESIRRNAPEVALDRLHTFVVKYIRHLCKRHGIIFDRHTPLHSLFGMYVKHMKKKGLIESEMTERILKSSISILDSFNDVRNNQSFAHDNPLLNHDEALLIFNNIAASIRFLEAIEDDKFEIIEDENDFDEDDIPF